MGGEVITLVSFVIRLQIDSRTYVGLGLGVFLLARMVDFS